MLTTVRLFEFDGHPNTSVRKYRGWKKYLDAIKFVNRHSDQEFALILFFSARHRTKVSLSCLELDQCCPRSLEEVWLVRHRPLSEALAPPLLDSLEDCRQELEWSPHELQEVPVLSPKKPGSRAHGLFLSLRGSAFEADRCWRF